MIFKETDWLSWERASDFPRAYQDPPIKMGTILPSWYKDLKTDIREYVPEGFDHNNTAKLCLGLRGMSSVGYTIPVWYDHKPNPGWKEMHPEQLHGTKWTEKDTDGNYIWGIWLISYPWRARMDKGWRLMITGNTLEFSPDWHVFAGCVDANYRVIDGQLGSRWKYDNPVDTCYNYYNIEMVIALKKNKTIPIGTAMFTLIPLYDPEYQPSI